MSVKIKSKLTVSAKYIRPSNMQMNVHDILFLLLKLEIIVFFGKMWFVNYIQNSPKSIVTDHVVKRAPADHLFIPSNKNEILFMHIKILIFTVKSSNFVIVFSENIFLLPTLFRRPHLIFRYWSLYRMCLTIVKLQIVLWQCLSPKI